MGLDNTYNRYLYQNCLLFVKQAVLVFDRKMKARNKKANLQFTLQDGQIATHTLPAKEQGLQTTTQIRSGGYCQSPSECEKYGGEWHITNCIGGDCPEPEKTADHGTGDWDV